MSMHDDDWGDDRWIPEEVPQERLEASDPSSVPLLRKASEAESLAAFDQVIDSLDYFRIYREVRGKLTQPRLAQVREEVKIDRILVPTQSLADKGWKHGPIGVEAKAPEQKMGPCISQMLDYSRSVFTLMAGYNIMLNWIFMWHVGIAGDTVASILAQNRLGTASVERWDTPQGRLRLWSGNSLAVFYRDGTVMLGAGKNGQRTGSR